MMIGRRKTLIGTGVTSGIGFALVKQLLLDHPDPYHLILGVRDPVAVRDQFEEIPYDRAENKLVLFQVDFAHLSQVKRFGQLALNELGEQPLDYVFHCQVLIKEAEEPGPDGSKWSEPFFVNYLSQHYLMHLLQPAISRSAPHTRIVFVSSASIQMPVDFSPSAFEPEMYAAARARPMKGYIYSKHAQILSALWWKRQLQVGADGKHLPKADQGGTVVAVDPWMVMDTGCGRFDIYNESMIDRNIALTPAQGAGVVWRAFVKDDFPEDPSAIVLSDQGEWLDRHEKFPFLLDEELQDRLSPSQAEIEREHNVH